MEKIMNGPQFLLVYYSPRYAAKEAHAREQLLEKLKEILQSQGKVNAQIHKGAMKFAHVVLKPDVQIDMAKVLKEAKFDGYYVVTSSILDESPEEILKKYKFLSVDERDFRILKTCLDLRPVYLRTVPHLVAYVLICMISIRVLRYLQDLLENAYSPEQIQISMKMLGASKDRDGRWYHLNGDDPIIRTLYEKTGIGFDRMDYTMDELKKLFEIEEVHPNPFISL